MLIVTPGINAPDGSATVPLTVDDCANKFVDARKVSSARAAKICFLIFPPKGKDVIGSVTSSITIASDDLSLEYWVRSSKCQASANQTSCEYAKLIYSTCTGRLDSSRTTRSERTCPINELPNRAPIRA